MSEFNTLLPAPTCVICHKTLDQIGGRRITAQQLCGMTISNIEWTVHDRPNLRYCERLVSDQDVFLIVWGEDDIWTPEVIEKIKTTYMSDLHPWICQGYRCGNRQCPDCGFANNLPIASDLLYDDGRNPHLMIIPADCGCVNRNCGKYRKFNDSWEIVEVDKG